MKKQRNAGGKALFVKNINVINLSSPNQIETRSPKEAGYNQKLASILRTPEESNEDSYIFIFMTLAKPRIHPKSGVN